MNQTNCGTDLCGPWLSAGNYDLPDLFANNAARVVTNAKRIDRKKSASQWSLGLVYDKNWFQHVLQAFEDVSLP